MNDTASSDTALIGRLQTHLRRGTSDGAPGGLRLPAEYYLDPGQWQREMDNIFRRLPLLAGFSAELPEPGNFRALQMLDKPVLLMRGADGQVRAFLNICRHRGAPLKSGSGSCRHLVCPYHAWRYNDRGELLRVQDEDKFGAIDKSRHGLRELPCAEDAGLIFVSLSGEPFDLREYLGGMLDELRGLGMERWHLRERREVLCGNWKLAHDGYLDGYHVASLHPRTVGPVVHNNVLLYDHWGPHQRMCFARRSLGPETDTESASLAAETTVIRTIFPNVSMSLTPGWGGMISVLWPGTATLSRTEQTFLYAHAADDRETAEAIRAEIDIYHIAVRDEDYPMVDSVQRNMMSGAVDEVLFGRNELGCQRWHAWVKHYCAGEAGGGAPDIPMTAVGGG